MKDGYDHYVRDDQEYWNTVRYILHNPVKAKRMQNWEDFPHTYCLPEVLEELDI